MSTLVERIEAVVAVARAWRDPEHPARADAVARTLAAANRFTEESVAFAVNQAMHAANPTALRRWTDGREAAEPALVGVWAGDPVPLAGRRALMAAFLGGHRAVVRLDPASPALLPTFAAELERRAGTEGTISFEPDWPETRAEAAYVIASGSDEDVAALAARCDALGVPPARRLLRGERYAVAVLGAEETPEARIGLAEDAWLHGGLGPRSVRLVWAPEGLSPDPFLDAFAAFHELFPPHPEREGALEMPRAFLKAARQPYAWGEGFLMSRGAPEVQTPGHLRWAEYADPGSVVDWLRAQADLSLVVASPDVAGALDVRRPVAAPGDAHRPRLDDAEGEAVYRLLLGRSRG